LLILETTVNNYSIYIVGKIVAFLVFKQTVLWVHIDILEKHLAFTYSVETVAAAETKYQPEDYNFSNSPCSTLLTHLSLFLFIFYYVHTVHID
jgi:hypothetical protein